MHKIGVFDSGIGGQSVANAISAALPNSEVIFVNDKANVPYGSKPPEELYELVLPILDKLSNEVDVIVVACNTVSTTLITKLRQHISVPLVAMEPMVKPAANTTETNKIIVCATPATLASERYSWLKDTYAKDVMVIEPDCSEWAFMIEHNNINNQKIRNSIEPGLLSGADVIVLGCTHYHWIEEDIRMIANTYNATVIQPELPVIDQLKRVLAQLV